MGENPEHEQATKGYLMAITKSSDYQHWLSELKERIRSAQIRARLAVNSELVLLYWTIGKDILAKQAEQGWGSKVIDRLASDLRQEFPDVKGFSRSNLLYMRAFAKAWDDIRIVQAVLGQLPWYHHIALLDKLDSNEHRIWYAKAAAEHGWSRNVLVHQIETKLHERQGTALTNFQKTLPAPQADLAQQMVKDPMVFDFLELGPDARELEVELGLLSKLTDFLLELGTGFSFCGRQYRLEVGGQEYFLDLLFYHTKLHCYVVIELKIDEFKPEYVGKMNFYLSAVDDLVRADVDGPSIGIILCKSKNGVIVEYALRDSTKPIGIAEYTVAPPALADALPSVAQLQESIGELDS